MSELKPCPFCKATNVEPDCTHIFAGEEACQIRCQNCGSTGPLFGRESPAKAVEVASRAWNKAPRAEGGGE